jgi:3-phosphoshikimate 1-carboxyvinyltransferase
MPTARITPARRIRGELQLPGDKSISHRYAILAALADGPSEIANYSSANDCARTLACLERLGVALQRDDNRVRITGAGLTGLRKPWRKLDAGNSGTTMRLLAGVLAGQPFAATLTGDDSLRRRPMRRIIEPLTQMGAGITAQGDGLAPLEIRGGPLRAIDYTLPLPSAQVKSCLLLAGLFAEGVTSVTEPVRTRDHLELALAHFGVEARRVERSVRIAGRQRLAGRRVGVPGDFSSAVFFLAAALLVPESHITLHNVGLNPTRTAVLDCLAGLGAPIRLTDVVEESGELVGTITAHHGQLQGGAVSGAATAQMIDELPMLAALAPFTAGGVEIRDAQELRVKESDRIAALAGNLRRIGAEVEELPDGLRIPGGQASRLRGAEVDPRGDHRIAMAFAVAGLALPGDTAIHNAECAAVSFPEFFPLLDAITQR